MALSKSDIDSAIGGDGAIDVFESWEKTFPARPTDVTADQHLHVSGWALAPNPHAVFDRFFAVVDGEVAQSAEYGIARPDVTHALQNKHVLRCGFAAKFPVANLPPGPHVLTFFGVVAERVYILVAPQSFNVLALPTSVARQTPTATLPGRVREVGAYYQDASSPGRGASSVPAGQPLSISGWQAASARCDIPEAISVLLTGPLDSYRVATAHRMEPEAGVVGGAGATACGFHTCVDTRRIRPGVYHIDLEVVRRQDSVCVAGGAWVEIMNDVSSWFPNALPIYRTALESTFETPLPATIKQGETLVICGLLHAPEALAGLFARFDAETSYALTSVTTAQKSSLRRKSGKLVYTFGGLLRHALPVGQHTIEILALDEFCYGAWVVLRHTFTVVNNTIDEGSVVDQSVANPS